MEDHGGDVCRLLPLAYTRAILQTPDLPALKLPLRIEKVPRPMAGY